MMQAALRHPIKLFPPLEINQVNNKMIHLCPSLVIFLKQSACNGIGGL